MICWENYMPLLRTAMYAKGIELYCAITVDDRDTWIPTVRHIALEGRCFVLSACQFLESQVGRGVAHFAQSPEHNEPVPLSADGLRPDSESTEETSSSTPLIRGGSCIIGPLGQVLAGPSYGSECILIADLDSAELARGKFDFDVVGHYSRPDVFRLEVNERPMSPVVFHSGND